MRSDNALMINHFRKTTIKISFDTLVDQLKNILVREGFVITGVTDYQQQFMDRMNIHFRKHVILTVDIPLLAYEMLSIAPFEGMVLPCNITMAERYPGEVEIVPVNPTALLVMGIQDASLQNLAEQFSQKLERVIRSLERESNNMPDMVTSWS